MGKILADIRHVFQILMVLLLTVFPVVSCEYCPGHGSVCPPPQQCCNGGSMCCTLSDQRNRDDDFHGYDSDLQFGVWNLWFVVIFLFMACTGACAFWRHRRRLLMAEQAALATVSFGSLVPSRRLHCPPSQLSSEPSRNSSLNRFSYFSTVLASSPSTQEPHGEFPSPPPYSEIATKSSEIRSNTFLTDLPPYSGGFGLDTRYTQAGGPLKGAGTCSESVPCRGVSNVATSPPSYSLLSSAISPPIYTVDSLQSRSAASYPSLRHAPSVDSGDELIAENTNRGPAHSPP